MTTPFPISLGVVNGELGFGLAGNAAGDRAGWSVASAGDVNGDGFDDMIIGAWGADPGGRDNAGQSYVVFGKPRDGNSGLALASLNGSNGFALTGFDAGGRSGWSVSSAGDVNGDGFDDVLIGAYLANPGGRSTAGESYVVFGTASGFGASLNLSTLDGTTGFRLGGVDVGDGSGHSVSSAGDFNGDGFDDVIISAPFADPGGRNAVGESYVVFGKASGPTLDLSALDGTNGFRIDGIGATDFSGRSVSSAGDVNGDGFDDLIIGDPSASPSGRNGAGESYVVFGKASGFGASLDLATLDGANGFRVNGIDASDGSGSAVSSAGDVNGDGFDDVIIGAPSADPGGRNAAGESYVVFGKASGFDSSLDLAALDGTNGFRLDGIGALDQSGTAVSSAGDLNGDGFDDLLIGAPAADPNGRAASGETYVFFGRPDGFAPAVALSSLIAITGVDAGDFSGRSVSSAGDVDGDGFDDIIIGSPNAANGSNQQVGEATVLYGNSRVFRRAPEIDGLDANAARFNGTGYLTVANDPALALDESWTIEALIRTSDADAQTNRVVTKPTGGAQTFSLLVIDGEAHIRFDVVGGGSRFVQAGFVADGDLHHIAGRYDEAAGTLSLFVDGMLAGALDVTGAQPRASSEAIHIGRFSGAINQTFNGDIVEVRVWDAARSDAEIAGGVGGLADPAGESGLQLNVVFAGGVAADAGQNGFAVTTNGTAPAPTIALSTAEGQPLTIVGLQFDDADTPAGLLLTASAANGTVSINGGGSSFAGTLAELNAASVVFTPDPGFIGTDTITLTIDDQNPLGAQQDTLTIDVAVFQAPEAPSLVVTTANDVVDLFDGETSLREALAFAESDPDASTITFDASLDGSTLRLTQGQLVIATEVTIDGDLDDDGAPDITVSGDADGDGTGDTRILTVQAGAVATIDGLILRDGFDVGADGVNGFDQPIDSGRRGTPGGDAAGTILNLGDLTLLDSVIRDGEGWGGHGGDTFNVTALGANGGAATGGILNGGTLSLAGVTFDDNSAVGGRGGDGLKSYVFTYAVPGGGGGAAASDILNMGGGVLTLDDVVITSGHATGGQGGMGGDGAEGLPFAGVDGARGGRGGAAGGIVNFGSASGGVVAWDGIATAGAGGAGGHAGFSFNQFEDNDQDLHGDPGPPGAAGAASAGVLNLGTGAIETTFVATLLDGTAGDDTLSGTPGADLVRGLEGNDTLDGGAGDDILYGGAGNDMLNGGAGNDRMSGGSGNDTYVVAAAGDLTIEAASGGIDTVRSYINWTLADNVERLELQGSGNLNGTGNALANTLVGNAGNNLLNGGAGNDYMVGGAGNDTFVVEAAGDSTIESAGGGTDTVRSYINWTLGANVERLELQGSGNLNGTGNALANTLVGNAGNNLLNGGAGNDYMVGGGGDDIYIVAASGDRTIEAAGAGTDTVRSYINWMLADNVEHLELQGSGNLNGTGNALNNTLVGNAGNNLLNGGDGNDTMAGGTGDDIYVVAAAGDSTIENAGQGTDTVRSSINWTLAANVERLELQGSGNINGTGNTLANTLVGNAGNNSLSGGDGNDYIVGGAGNDTLTGGAGNDRLIGGAGRDSLNGGAGNDTFDFDLVSDSPAGPALRDSIVGGFSHGSDRIDLATIDANTLVGGNQAFSFIGSAAFSGVAGQLRYTNYSGNVIIDADVNGDSTADMQILVAGTTFMAETDFIL
jgi:Ca2+-binding RTX toxin-like protein